MSARRADLLRELEGLLPRVEPPELAAVDEERRRLTHEIRNLAAVVGGLEDDEDAGDEVRARIDALRADVESWERRNATTVPDPPGRGRKP